MIDIEYKVTDPGLVDAYIQLCDHAPDFVNAVTNRTVNDSRDEILTDFRQEPPQSSDKIEWTSDKQRRYVMAMKRKGIIKSPHVRQHRTSKGWRAEVIYTPGELSSIELWNEEDVTSFVEGLHQQKWLAKIGWLHAPDLAEKWQHILVDRVETDLIKAFYAVEPGQTTYA